MTGSTPARMPLLTILLVASGACAREGPESTLGPDLAASPNAPVHMVTGGGQVDIASTYAGFDESTISFTAMVDANGNAQGQLQATFSFPFEEKVHMELACLAVEGNEAWIGGTVTKSHPRGAWLGQVFIVRFQDNGEGGGSPPDRMSHFRGGGAIGPNRCLNQPTGSPEFDLLFPYVSGNVVVK